MTDEYTDPFANYDERAAADARIEEATESADEEQHYAETRIDRLRDHTPGLDSIPTRKEQT